MAKVYHNLIFLIFIISFGCEENPKQNNPSLLDKPVDKKPEINKDLIKKFPLPVIKVPDTCRSLLRGKSPRGRLEKIEKEKRRYYRCYQQFTMSRLKNDDPRLVKIRNGEISGVDACMELLNTAALRGGESSSSWEMANGVSAEGKSVFKTFNDLHRTWFTNLKFPQVNQWWHTEDLLDAGEGALFYTRSLFADQVPYKAILKGSSVLGGLRETSFESRNHTDHTGHLGYYLNPGRNGLNEKKWRILYGSTGYSFGRDHVNSGGWNLSFNTVNRWKAYEPSDGDSSKSFIQDNAPIVQTGLLVGIRSRSKYFENTNLRKYCGLISCNANNWGFNGFGGVDLGEAMFKYTQDGNGDPVESATFRSYSKSLGLGRGLNVKIGQTGPVDLFKSAGGGAMGSHAFVLQNMDNTFPVISPGSDRLSSSARYSRMVADGSVKLQRRWAKRVLSDFLCREVPVINNADLESDEVEYVDLDSNLPFRRQYQCMGCHATMDQMAMTIRNTVIEKTGTSNSFKFANPNLGAGDLCVPTKDKRVSVWTDGAWVEQDSGMRRVYEVKNLNTDYIPTYCGPTPTIDENGHKRYEVDRKAYWPNHQDRVSQHQVCQKDSQEELVNVTFDSLSPERWHEEPYVGYHKTKPLGKFLFRPFNAKVEDSPINVNVNGVEELAAAVRRTPDFYACGAKRYLEFLSGIKTIMLPESNDSHRINPTERRHQKIMNCLADELKTSNNPKNVILKIIASDFYLDPSILNVKEAANEDQEAIALAAVQSLMAGKSCSGCHAGVQNWSKTDFTQNIWPGGKGEAAVVPGQPCESTLFTSLSLDDGGGYDPCYVTHGEGYKYMPLNRPDAYLNREELETIYDWISELD